MKKIVVGLDRKVLDEASADCRKRNIAVDAVISTGKPAEMLAGMSYGRDIDLVVVGHRGRGAIARTLLGSVADRLVQISEKPVLVAR